MNKHFLILAVPILIFPIIVMAQSDGTAIPTETPVATSALLPADTTTTGTSRTTAPTATIAPKPTSVSAPAGESIAPAPAVSIDPPVDFTNPTDNPGEFSWSLISLIATGVGLVLGFFGIKAIRRMPNQKAGNNRCDGIRDLLEQKKKELEDFVRNWPEEKIKALAKEAVVAELKKNDDSKKIIETAESLKAKHDKLKKTIELLEKQYNLCMLELPSLGKQMYRGTIVENSLRDKKVLDELKIIKKYQDEDWTLHDVIVSGEKIGKIGENLADGPWYMDFWKEEGDEGTVVFKDKSFQIKSSDKSTWTEAIEYGKSKGIPEEQLDFKDNKQ